MGYRSEVVCAFVFQDELVRDAFHTTAMNRFCDDAVPDWDIRDKEWFTTAFTTDERHDNYVLLMQFDEVKWYPDLEVPKFVENEMMPECVVRGGAYSFVRLGEETEDIVESSDNHSKFGDFDADDYVRVARYIEIP
jgi:hypothetical protein